MNQWRKGERISVLIGRPSYPWYWFSHLASVHVLPEWIGVSAVLCLLAEVFRFRERLSAYKVVCRPLSMSHLLCLCCWGLSVSA